MNRMTLDDAVAEMMNLLTGLDLTYDPELDRYRSMTRALNRGLRDNSLEAEWAHYAAVKNFGAGLCRGGDNIATLPPFTRPRINGDDSVRLVNDRGVVVRWAYFLPRDALHKYRNLQDLWVSANGGTLTFSRPFTDQESELSLVVPVMREPRMFRLPPVGETVPDRVRKQILDFNHPDLIVARATYRYAQSDPVAQPRVPTLEQDYKTLMYQLIERDTNHTDTPYQNAMDLGIRSGLTSGRVGPPIPKTTYF